MGSPSAGLPKREPFSSDGQVDKPIELELSTSIRDFLRSSKNWQVRKGIEVGT